MSKRQLAGRDGALGDAGARINELRALAGDERPPRARGPARPGRAVLRRHPGRRYRRRRGPSSTAAGAGPITRFPAACRRAAAGRLALLRTVTSASRRLASIFFGALWTLWDHRRIHLPRRRTPRRWRPVWAAARARRSPSRSSRRFRARPCGTRSSRTRPKDRLTRAPARPPRAARPPSHRRAGRGSRPRPSRRPPRRG